MADETAAVRRDRSPTSIAAARSRRAARESCTHWAMLPSTGSRRGQPLYVCIVPAGCGAKWTLDEVDEKFRAMERASLAAATIEAAGDR